MSECDTCAYFVYDEDWECYVCDMDIDEDDYARMMQHPKAHCPYYRNGDEYAVARKQ